MTDNPTSPRSPGGDAAYGASTMKLYRVRTTAKEYHGYRDIVFQWFRHAMPQGQRLYADLIKDYEPRNRDAFYVEAYIEELFTWDEARQSKAYLDQYHGDQGDTV